LRIQLGSQARAVGSIRFESFDVDLPTGATLLDAPEYIRTGVAPDLMYRHSCHHGSCGTCAVRVDGKEMLACLTPLESFGGRVPTIEPLRALKLEKDLAVDPGALFRSLPNGAAHLRASEWVGDEVAPSSQAAAGDPEAARQSTDTSRARKLPEGATGFVRFEDCVECGSCVSACPVTARSWNAAKGEFGGFAGPAALAATRREALNNPARAEEMLTLAARPDGVAACEKHFDCSRVCPRMVYPGKHIEMLRRELARK